MPSTSMITSSAWDARLCRVHDPGCGASTAEDSTYCAGCQDGWWMGRRQGPLLSCYSIWSQAVHCSQRDSAAFYAYAQHSAIGFAPFGIDSAQLPHPLADTYALLNEMMPLLVERQGLGKMAGVFQQDDDERWEIQLGGYVLQVHTRWPLQAGQAPGGGLVLDIGDGQYVVAGRSLMIEFGTAPGRTDIEFLWLEEGSFRGGQWVPGRRLNGDETAHGRRVQLGSELGVCRLKLNQHVMPICHQERMMVG